MTTAPLTAQDYYRVALGVLGESGSDGLTISQVCERLVITKGSFYHHFGSMAGFVTGLLEHWESEHNDRLIAATRAEPDPGVRLYRLIEYGVTLPHAPEAAIRAWAHSNDEVARAVARVDARRDATITEAIEAVGLPSDRAGLFSDLSLTLLVGIQNRDRAPDPGRVQQLFGEVLTMVAREADPARLSLPPSS